MKWFIKKITKTGKFDIEKKQTKIKANKTLYNQLKLVQPQHVVGLCLFYVRTCLSRHKFHIKVHSEYVIYPKRRVILT